jgi:acyl-homoserine lactone acylase PvdQ
MKISYLLLALIAVAAVVLFFALEASLPKTKGQILFTNNKYLENQTSITTDSDGVVHIKAHDKLSAFFTLG